MNFIKMNRDGYSTYGDEGYGEEVLNAGWIPQLVPTEERLSEHRIEPARAAFPLFAPPLAGIDEDFGLLSESLPHCP